MKPEAVIFADDRPMALDDDLYQWALDAETLIRRQYADLAAAQQEIARLRAALGEAHGFIQNVVSVAEPELLEHLSEYKTVERMCAEALNK